MDGDNVAIEAGIASKGSGTDIDRETRHVSTPDIGADEMPAAVGGDIVIFRRRTEGI